jgi:hypothetical protein
MYAYIDGLDFTDMKIDQALRLGGGGVSSFLVSLFELSGSSNALSFLYFLEFYLLIDNTLFYRNIQMAQGFVLSPLSHYYLLQTIFSWLHVCLM